MARPQRPRLVRQENWLKKTLARPQEWWEEFLEGYSVVEVWEENRTIAGYLTAAVLNFVHIISKAGDSFNGDSNLVVQSLLVLVSFANFVYLMVYCRRNYQLLNRSGDESNLPSPNAKVVFLKPRDVPVHALSFPGNLWHAVSRTLFGNAQSNDEQRVLQLSVWEPSPFSLTVFQLFSPVHAVLLWTIQNDIFSFFVHILLLSLLSVMLFILTWSYQQLIRDRQLIFEEMQHINDEAVHQRTIVRPINEIMKDQMPDGSTRDHWLSNHRTYGYYVPDRSFYSPVHNTADFSGLPSGSHSD